jgi:hypothetical protein
VGGPLGNLGILSTGNSRDVGGLQKGSISFFLWELC